MKAKIGRKKQKTETSTGKGLKRYFEKRTTRMNDSTYSFNDLQEELTVDKLNEAIKEIEKLPDPFQSFAKAHGFDLNKGDLLLIPEWIAIKYNMPPHKNVIFDEKINDILLMKNPYNKLLNPTQTQAHVPESGK